MERNSSSAGRMKAASCRLRSATPRRPCVFVDERSVVLVQPRVQCEGVLLQPGQGPAQSVAGRWPSPNPSRWLPARASHCCMPAHRRCSRLHGLGASERTTRRLRRSALGPARPRRVVRKKAPVRFPAVVRLPPFASPQLPSGSAPSAASSCQRSAVGDAAGWIRFRAANGPTFEAALTHALALPGPKARPRALPSSCLPVPSLAPRFAAMGSAARFPLARMPGAGY